MSRLPFTRARWKELARISDHYAEQAARLHLDHQYSLALEVANRGIDVREKLYRRGRDNRDVVEVFAEDLRNRAEIQSTWMQARRMAGTDRADDLLQGGIADATRALGLFEELARVPDAEYPQRPAEVRLMLSELLAMAGDFVAAGRQAELSIADYRRHRTGDEEGTELRFARALARYADIMGAVGAPDLGVPARRESVELSGPRAGPGGWLWRWRFDRRLVWLSTPTMERHCLNASLLAAQLVPATAAGPASVAGPVEALLAFQTAAEGYASLIRFVYGPQPDALPETVQLLERQAELLRTYDQPKVADAYLTARDRLASLTDGGWHDVVSQLRPSLERAVERMTSDRADPDAPRSS